MKKPVLKFTVNHTEKHYSIVGNVITEDGEFVAVGYSGAQYDKAREYFDYWSDANGYETQRVIIRQG